MSSEEEKWAAVNHALRIVKDKLLKAQLDIVKLAAERDTLQTQLAEKDLSLKSWQNLASIRWDALTKLENEIFAKDKEIERLKGIEKDHLNDWKRIQDAERENDELRAALEFYADRENWHKAYGSCSSSSFTMNQDCGDVSENGNAVGGKRARQALQNTKKEG